MEIKDFVTFFASGAFGAFTGFFSPWFAWSVEQKKELRLHRRKMIETWRNELLDLSKVESSYTSGGTSSVRIAGNGMGQQIYAKWLASNPFYVSLGLHLSEGYKQELNRSLQNDAIQIVIGSDGPPSLYRKLADEIATLEKSWNLM